MPKFTKLPSVEELHKFFEYKSDTGKLYWKQEYNNGKASYKIGDEVNLTEACNRAKSIYYRISYLGKKYQLSRIIYKMFTGEDPKGVIDHIDGNTKNNKIENLRDISQGHNVRRAKKGKWISYNPKPKKGSKPYKRSAPYEVSFSYEGKRYTLGYFKTYEDAEKRVAEWRQENQIRRD